MGNSEGSHLLRQQPRPFVERCRHSWVVGTQSFLQNRRGPRIQRLSFIVLVLGCRGTVRQMCCQCSRGRTKTENIVMSELVSVDALDRNGLKARNINLEEHNILTEVATKSRITLVHKKCRMYVFRDSPVPSTNLLGGGGWWQSQGGQGPDISPRLPWLVAARVRPRCIFPFKKKSDLVG